MELPSHTYLRADLAQVADLVRQHCLHQFRRDRLLTRLVARFECQCQVQLDLQRRAYLGGQHIDRLGRQDRPQLGLAAGADAKQPMDGVVLAAGDFVQIVRVAASGQQANFIRALLKKRIDKKTFK